MLLEFLTPMVLGVSIVIVVGGLIGKVLTGLVPEIQAAGDAPTVNVVHTPSQKAWSKLGNRLEWIVWFNVKLVFVYLEALLIWYGMFWMILSAIEQAAAQNAVPDIIAWSIALGFLVCAACVRLWSALDRLTDDLAAKVMLHLAPLQTRASSRVQQFMLRHFPAKPRLPKIRQIVAEYGPLTDAEVAVRQTLFQKALIVMCMFTCGMALLLFCAMLATLEIGRHHPFGAVSLPVFFLAVAVMGISMWLAHRHDAQKKQFIDQVIAYRS